MINAADGAPLGGSVTKNSKISVYSVPRRGPDAGVLRREDGFHGTGVNRIDSCLFPQSKKCLFPNFYEYLFQGRVA